ncbi:hypothetical protein TNCV_2515121 [Trichonephila clavipes]|nr:hypothetical protein TNCV_2515121 [Trichonephila clavipes]
MVDATSIAMSPDLNPIEHVRDILECSIAARRPAPTTIDELKSTLVQEWGWLPQELIRTLVNSMKHRSTRGLSATDLVILNHGQVTRTTPELVLPLLTTTLHHTNGRTFELSTDLTCIAPQHDGPLVVLGSNSSHASHDPMP